MLFWAAALILPAAAPAQRVGFLVGPDFQGNDGVHALGVHLGMTLGARPRTGLSARVDLSYTTHTPPAFRGVSALCPQPPQPCEYGGGPPQSLTVLSTTVDAVYFDPKDTHQWGYWIAGAGLYGITRSPHASSYLRAGWNVGFGWRVDDGAFVEVRYHGIIHPTEIHAFLPIVLGVRF
jgi:hypothetical protein